MQGGPILLSLQSSARTDGEPGNGMQLLTSGELITLPDGYLIRYEETIHELAPPTRVELSLKEDIVTMLRSGEHEANLVFRKGQRCESQYTTPFGSMDMAIFCTRMLHGMDEHGGYIHLQYQLDLNGHFAAMHEMDVRFALKEAGG